MRVLCIRHIPEFDNESEFSPQEILVKLQTLAPDAYFCGTDDPIRFYRTPIIGKLYRRRVARCIDMLPAGQRVLEIGYGSGASFLNLGEKFQEIHGLDLHSHIAEVSRSFASSNLDLHLQQGDVSNLPYADNTFDSAVAISIHEHLQPEQQRRAFAQVRRVLKPGGTYVVGVPGMNALMGMGFRVLGYRLRELHFTSEKQVLESMREVFDIQETREQLFAGLRKLTMYLSIRGCKGDYGQGLS